MQQKINLYLLLPKKSNLTLNGKLAAFFYFGLVLILIISYLIQSWKTHQVMSQYAIVNKAAVQSEKEFEELNKKYPINDPENLGMAIQQLEQQLSNKQRIVNILSPDSHFADYFTALAQAVFSGVWLTEIIFENAKDEIYLKGFATESQFVQTLLEQMKRQPSFSHINFQLSNLVETTSPVSFDIATKKVSNL